MPWSCSIQKRAKPANQCIPGKTILRRFHKDANACRIGAAKVERCLGNRMKKLCMFQMHATGHAIEDGTLSVFIGHVTLASFQLPRDKNIGQLHFYPIAYSQLVGYYGAVIGINGK